MTNCIMTAVTLEGEESVGVGASQEKKASWKKGRGLSVMLTCIPNSWQCLP